MNTELYVTGSGQELEVHERTDECVEFGCCIHSPSPEAEAIGYTHWRPERGLMERICEHGIGHPDPDALAYRKRMGHDHDSVHGCDGCCVKHLEGVDLETLSRPVKNHYKRAALASVRDANRRFQTAQKDRVEAIKRARGAGATYQEIARTCLLTVSAVHEILNRRPW